MIIGGLPSRSVGAIGRIARQRLLHFGKISILTEFFPDLYFLLLCVCVWVEITLLIDGFKECQSDERARSPSVIAEQEPLPDRAQLRKLLDQHHQQPIIPLDTCSLVRLLQACGNLKALPDGHCVHHQLALLGFEKDLITANYLITMYGNCFSVPDALDAFRRICPRNVVSWTSMITVFTRHDQSLEALSLFHQMQLDGIKPNKVTFASLLTACASIEAFADGRKAHAYIVELGFESDIVVNNALINMYDKCGSVTDAQSVFDVMQHRDVITWTAMIVANTQHGHSKEALLVFQSMLNTNVKPNAVTLVNILSATAALKEGMTVHFLIIEGSFEQQNVVANTLLIFYGNEGCVEDAFNTFDRIIHPNASNLTTMIAVSAQHGLFHKSWHFFDLLQDKSMQVNKVTLITVLNACTCAETITKGENFHMCIVNCGYESDVIVGNALINMYNRCGSLEHAKATFFQMPSRDVVSLTSMIVAYTQHGFYDKACKLFKSMIEEGMKPDTITFISILSACVDPGALDLGLIIHAKVLENEFESDVILGNALMTMYGRCGSVGSAEKIFKCMQNKNTVSWNAMISFHVQAGNIDEAIRLFQQMQFNGVKADRVSFVSILSTCTCKAMLNKGRLIHTLLADNALELDDVVGNALVTMYGKCGSVMDAKCIFDAMHKCDVVAWTSMIAAYAQLGDSVAVVNLFDKMQSKAVKPDKFTLSLVVAACSMPEMLQDGENVHARMMQSDIETDIVLENAVINMYGKCGSVVNAQKVFDKMLERDLFSFNAMIAAHAQFLHGNEAFQTFQQMQLEGIEPDRVTYLGVLSACSSRADLNVGKIIHALIWDGGFEQDDAVANALMNMYSKCGSVKYAWETFESLPERSIVSWTTMITAFADHGHTRKAFEVFELMEDEGIEPNEVSFVSILSACSRAGLVEQALKSFKRINGAKKSALKASHYGCLVDLLTRVGRLEEAELFLYSWPGQPGVVDWMTLLSASKTFDDLQRGKRAAEHLLELDQQCTAAYIVLGNAYAGSVRRDDEENYLEMWE